MTESEKAQAFDWLMKKLQRSYDGFDFDLCGLSIVCQMVSGWKGYRYVSAKIRWSDNRDEPLDLLSAIKKAMDAEVNHVPSP